MVDQGSDKSLAQIGFSPGITLGAVILSEAKNLPLPTEILRFAQNDSTEDQSLQKNYPCKGQAQF